MPIQRGLQNCRKAWKTSKQALTIIIVKTKTTPVPCGHARRRNYYYPSSSAFFRCFNLLVKHTAIAIIMIMMIIACSSLLGRQGQKKLCWARPKLGLVDNRHRQQQPANKSGCALQYTWYPMAN